MNNTVKTRSLMSQGSGYSSSPPQASVTEKVTNLFDSSDVSSSASIVAPSAPTSAWVSDALNQMADWLYRSEFVNPGAFARAVNFISSIRPPVRRPFIALGDDGSIGIEWDRNGHSLHLTFSGYGDEFYWSRGEDWEAEGLISENQTVFLLAVQDSALR
ncbi:hypothetical protein ACGFMK_26210 [Amycolatopsis sp. NPDC049252]|uniref:hypothetical protein n=1 Tax=Amycolatopsis sp. NPDC049252 TaxID=3363933 RepID=UPI00371B683D